MKRKQPDSRIDKSLTLSYVVINFSGIKLFFSARVLCTLRLFQLKPEEKQYKHNTLLKGHKNKIKILANLGLA